MMFRGPDKASEAFTEITASCRVHTLLSSDVFTTTDVSGSSPGKRRRKRGWPKGVKRSCQSPALPVDDRRITPISSPLETTELYDADSFNAKTGDLEQSTVPLKKRRGWVKGRKRSHNVSRTSGYLLSPAKASQILTAANCNDQDGPHVQNADFSNLYLPDLAEFSRDISHSVSIPFKEADQGMAIIDAPMGSALKTVIENEIDSGANLVKQIPISSMAGSMVVSGTEVQGTTVIGNVLSVIVNDDAKKCCESIPKHKAIDSKRFIGSNGVVKPLCNGFNIDAEVVCGGVDLVPTLPDTPFSVSDSSFVPLTSSGDLNTVPPVVANNLMPTSSVSTDKPLSNDVNKTPTGDTNKPDSTPGRVASDHGDCGEVFGEGDLIKIASKN